MYAHSGADAYTQIVRFARKFLDAYLSAAL